MRRPKGLASKLADTLADGGWRAKARPSQLPPDGDWRIWLLMAGRGFGKTRTGAEWVKEQVETGQARNLALIAPTAADARDVMVEGVAGILTISEPWFRPEYEPSKRRLTWPNGATAATFSSEEPDRLRGPQFDAAWCDELAAWADPEATWDQLQFGLRLGTHPRCFISTTPRPIRILKSLLARQGQDLVLTTGATFENEPNLAPSFVEAIKARYEGTRLGRQELMAELLEEVQGALWTRAMLDDARVKVAPDMRRVVVAVDPSGTSGKDNGDTVGIVVCGLGVDGFGYVLADRSAKLSPAGWGNRVVAAYHEFQADRVVAERNFGGAMVEHVIRTADTNVAYKEVSASRGKIQRAEPVAALFEQKKVKLVGTFHDLEDQLTALTGSGYVGDGSPDRADALVWALSELMAKPAAEIPAIGLVVVPNFDAATAPHLSTGWSNPISLEGKRW